MLHESVSAAKNQNFYTRARTLKPLSFFVPLFKMILLYRCFSCDKYIQNITIKMRRTEHFDGQIASV